MCQQTCVVMFFVNPFFINSYASSLFSCDRWCNMSAFMQRVSSEVHEGEACVSQGSFSGWGVVWITSMVGILREDGICKFDTFLILLVMEKTLGYQMQIVSRLQSSVGSISGSNVQRDSRMRSSPSKPAPEMAGLPCWDERTRWMEPQERTVKGRE